MEAIARKGICVVWGFLIGLYMAMLIYPVIEEWRSVGQTGSAWRICARIMRRAAAGTWRKVNGSKNRSRPQSKTIESILTGRPGPPLAALRRLVR
jgi:hypothetical protein